MQCVPETHSASFWIAFPYRLSANARSASNFFHRAERFARRDDQLSSRR
jgi:hypothetical protein